MANESPAVILFDVEGNLIGTKYDSYNDSYLLQTSTQISDGYNGPVAVKPPNTAVLASDPALVVAISPNNPITITGTRPSINNTSSVAASLSNVMLLPFNSIRLGATIYNDSFSLLYIKLGNIAAVTDFTIKLFPLCYYEVPYGWIGEIDGIWVGDTGFARISELVA